MIFRKKERRLQPTVEKQKEEPTRLTQEEWAEVQSYNQKIAEIKKERANEPKLQDFVRILINGKIGQVSDISWEPIHEIPRYWFPPKDKVECARREYDSQAHNLSYYQNYCRYAARLKNGYIIRELRPWEIAKVSDR